MRQCVYVCLQDGRGAVAPDHLMADLSVCVCLSAGWARSGHGGSSDGRPLCVCVCLQDGRGAVAADHLAGSAGGQLLPLPQLYPPGRQAREPAHL